jgi:hypothetical protein
MQPAMSTGVGAVEGPGLGVGVGGGGHGLFSSGKVLGCAGWRWVRGNRRGGGVNPAEPGGKSWMRIFGREPGAAAPWGELSRAANAAGAARRSGSRPAGPAGAKTGEPAEPA